MLSLGVVGTSRKENERRVPLHPDLLDRIPADLRGSIVFERGYCEPFGYSDERLKQIGFSTAPRAALFQDFDIVLLPKPVADDFKELGQGKILWGWPHCVQQRASTQVAIDRRLTLIAFEAMFRWTGKETKDLHVFYKNNEMAGYCGVIHALELTGMDGLYGRRRKAAVISLGSVSRGAIYALQGRGFGDITVYTQRPSHLVRDQVPGCRYEQFRRLKPDGKAVVAVGHDGSERPFIESLAQAGIIVNGILQDTDRPIDFMGAADTDRLAAGTLIVDVSCDEGMGFPFAKPTSFESPIFEVGKISYYAVDHTPSYLWRAASWEISASLLPYLPVVLAGPSAWAENETIKRSIEIRNGVIENPRILSFQKRSAEYPHLPLAGA